MVHWVGKIDYSLPTYSGTSIIRLVCLRSLTALILVITAQRVCYIAGDVVTITVTIWYTYETIKASREANVHAPMTSALLRSGEAASSII